MDAAMTFALNQKEKKQLNRIAHELSIEEGKRVTNGEVIRRALQQVYFSSSNKSSRAGKSRKRRGRPKNESV